MTRKVVTIDPRPRAQKEASHAIPTETWVRGGRPRLTRFTIELDPALHRRLRLEAARQGRRMADIVRELIDGACPE